ncbi:hypothetical protein ACH5RR_034573 [Cinchona calisaya]|uniref:F-box domain-containing protein n=1 Tax=Cinchona calisaya TaxID=153742 RepID=A0ABD2YBB3_9GENT
MSLRVCLVPWNWGYRIGIGGPNSNSAVWVILFTTELELNPMVPWNWGYRIGIGGPNSNSAIWGQTTKQGSEENSKVSNFMGKGAKVSLRSRLKKCSNRSHQDRFAQSPGDEIAELPEDGIVQLPEDLIGQLPDDILVLILSLLKLKEAAEASVVSRQWTTLWVYNPRLDFDAPKSILRMANNCEVANSERHNYVDWVNRIIQLHKGSTVDEFRICFPFNKCSLSQNEITKWLEYAFTRKVRRLELDLLNTCWPMCCDFPDRLLNVDFCLSSELPHLNYCGTQLPELIRFKSLRELILRCVNVTGEAIEFFLHNSPFLERLVVFGSSKLVSLLVSDSSRMLKHLEIKTCPNINSIKIHDSNIVSLVISVVQNLILMNVPKLTEVSVLRWRFIDWSHVFSQLSCCLSQLESLTLTIDPKSSVNIRDFPKLSQVKHLQIEVDAHRDDSLMGLSPLIKACPYLEKFVLRLHWLDTPPKIKREMEKGAKCSLKYLRVIEFAGYCDRVSDIELLEFFLENAVALEEIIVDCRGQAPLNHPFVKVDGLEQDATTCSLEEVKRVVPKHVQLVIL